MSLHPHHIYSATFFYPPHISGTKKIDDRQIYVNHTVWIKDIKVRYEYFVPQNKYAWQAMNFWNTLIDFYLPKYIKIRNKVPTRVKTPSDPVGVPPEYEYIQSKSQLTYCS